MLDFFDAYKLEEGGQPYVNTTKGVQERLASMWASPLMLKSLANFAIDKWPMSRCMPNDCPTCPYYMRGNLSNWLIMSEVTHIVSKLALQSSRHLH